MNKPRGYFVFGGFLLFAAVMATYAGITLSFPGTFLDALWKINPTAYQALSGLGQPIGAAFFALGIVALVIAYGWFTRRKWAWWMAVIGIAINMLADLTRLFSGEILVSLFSIFAAGLFVVYLMRPSVRQYFLNPGAPLTARS